ncbi:MAG: tetratricopeptide repeat protein [Acidobacteriaceae bacterium]
MRIVRRAHLAAALCGMLLCIPALAAAQQQPESPAMRQVRQAVSLAEHNDYPGALAIVDQVLAQDPRFVPALKLKAGLLETIGRTAEAAELYEKALQDAPNDPDLLLKAGISQLAVNNPGKAIGFLERCVRVAPKDGDAQYYLAQAYYLNGETDPALSAIRASAILEPGNGRILQKCGEYFLSAGKYPEALDWLTRAQKADATLPGIDYDLGAVSYKLMDLATAEKSLARAVQEQPNDFNALALLATVQIHLAKWNEATAMLRRALTIRPDDPGALLGLGHCEVELKEYAAAVDTLHRVLHADPTQLQAHFYLSQAYSALGQTAEAQHEAALHQLMMQPFTYMPFEAKQVEENAIVPEARALLEQHKEDEALQVYQRHVSGSYTTPGDAWVFVGKLYLFLGDRSNGLRCLHHALAIDPHVRGAHTYEGILALNDGDLGAAETDFEAELARDPNSQQATAEMGEVRYRQNRWADAARLLTQSKTMMPQLLYMLCDSDFHLQDICDADLTAELTEAWGRNDAGLMQNLLALLRKNGQTQLADRLEQDMTP